MERKPTKIIYGLLFVVITLSTYSFQKLTTTQMRENSIRINALELKEVNTNFPNKVEVSFDTSVLNFDTNKNTVKEEYVENLEKLKDFIMENDYIVTIVGYTDSTGGEKYNLALSERRARSVGAKLIEKGLDSSRIVGIYGRGESNPLATNKTEEGRQKNRRVEFYLEKR